MTTKVAKRFFNQNYNNFSTKVGQVGNVLIIPHGFGKKLINLINYICKLTLIIHGFMGLNLWVRRKYVHTSGPTG